MSPPRRRHPRTAGRPTAGRATTASIVAIPRVDVRLPEEEPHAHIVCRGCGRILGLELTELDRHLLEQLASLTPEGWSVDRIAYSLAGACRRCREGPSAR